MTHSIKLTSPLSAIASLEIAASVDIIASIFLPASMKIIASVKIGVAHIRVRIGFGVACFETTSN
jgi:hypothetical protein